MKKLAIFDLDGTLIDSSEGVLQSFYEVCDEFGLKKLDDFSSFIGPAVEISFQKAWNLSEEMTAKTAAFFREVYAKKHINKAKIYPGIKELLQSLKDAGFLLAIATNKRESYTKPLLKELGLFDFFDFIAGSDDDGKMSKKDLIALNMGILQAGIDECVMIGDSFSDLNAANELGVDFVAVCYGFGFNENTQFQENQLKFMAKNANELQEYLLTHFNFKNILKFKQAIEKMDENTPIIQYDYENLDNEFARIVRESDTEKLIEFWNEKCNHKCFDIEHPLIKGVKIRAIKNIIYHELENGCMFNLVYFSDLEQKYQVITADVADFCNYYLCYIDNKFYIFKIRNFCTRFDNPIKKSNINYLKNKLLELLENNNELYYRDVEFGFQLFWSRPFHYFFVLYKFYLKINYNKKAIKNLDTFFIPKDIKTNQNIVGLNSLYIDSGNKQMLVFLYNQSQKTQLDVYPKYSKLRNYINIHKCTHPFFSYFKSEHNTLKIWINIPGERRCWYQQYEGIALILSNLFDYFDDIFVYFDGMTAFDGQKQDFNDLGEYKKIENEFLKLRNDVDVNCLNDNSFFVANKGKTLKYFSMSGYDYKHKIRACTLCDFSICELGSACIITSIVHIPTVFYFYGEHKRWAVKALSHKISKSTDSISSKTMKHHRNPGYDSYHLDPAHVFNKTAELLEELNLRQLKGIKIKRLKEISVDEVILNYQKKNSQKNVFS